MLIGKPGREAFVQLEIVEEVNDCRQRTVNIPYHYLWQAPTTYNGGKITVKKNTQESSRQYLKEISCISLL